MPISNDPATGKAALPPPTIGEAFQQLRAAFDKGAIDNPTLDARLLVLAASQSSLNDFVARPFLPLSSSAHQILSVWATRRLNGEPVARILGEKEFWGLPFGLNAETLVPRPDTETLIEAALALYPIPPRTILDFGTGTGCILLALLHEWPQTRGTGLDISEQALARAQANAERLGMANRCDFFQSDWDASLPENSTFDLIISNPPYIPTADIAALDKEVRLYDPAKALDGGTDGLDDYRKIATAASQHLNEGGWLVLELGIGQEEDVTAILCDQGFTLTSPARCDLGGIPRALFARKESAA